MARPYIGGSNAAIMAVTGNTTLSAADHGKTLVVDGSAEGNFTITLPPTASSKGYETKIILGAANHGNTEVLITSDTNIIGFIEDSDIEQQVYATSGASRGFADAAKAGSRISLICDGAKWLILDAASDRAMITSIT